MSSETQSLLDSPISQFAQQDICELKTSMNVSAACQQVLMKGVGVVRNDEDFPLGVLTGALALRLLGQQGSLSPDFVEQSFPAGALLEQEATQADYVVVWPERSHRSAQQQEATLADYVGELSSVGTTPAHIGLRVILNVVLTNGIIPWFVLMEVRKSVGVVSPTTIAQALTHHLRSRGEESLHYLRAYRSGRAYDPGFIDVTDPNPNLNPPTCFCCPDDYQNQKPHRLARKQLTRDAKGDFLCPYHGQKITPSVDCTLC
jgi:hypothetical protein